MRIVALLLCLSGCFLFPGHNNPHTSPTDFKLFSRIANASTIRQPLVADCGIAGSVNSGSGIGVAVAINVANRPVRRMSVCRSGVCFDYDRLITTFSEIAGACWSATYTVNVEFADGSRCSATSTGNPPHTACTNAALRNSSAPVHAATYKELAGPGSIMAVFGESLTNRTESANSLPLPTRLAGVECYVFWNTSRQRQLKLFYASPTQVNVLMPDDLPTGAVTVQVLNVEGDYLRPGFFFSNVREPGIFTIGETGNGVAAGYLDQGRLVLFGTGFSDASNGFFLAGGRQYPAEYVGQAPGLIGVTQINVVAPRNTHGQICAGPEPVRCSQFFSTF